MAKNLFKNGSFTHDSFVKDATGKLVKQTIPGTLAELQGMFGHVKHVDEFNFRVRGEEIPSGRAALYKRFFLFSQFYCSSVPVILCEGKTDNVYLLHAIRSRAAHFPQLVSTSGTAQKTLLVRIFKYVERQAGKTIGMSGGDGEVSKFIITYLTEVFKRFKAPGVSQNPVILVVDHDSGGKGPYETGSKKAGRVLDIRKPFEHVAANLYLVPTPLPAGATSSCIEDCFQAATLAKTLGGKTFNYKTKTQTATEYGKGYFAEHVVQAEADTIDFSGFDPLLERIKSAISHYAALPK